MTRCGICYSRVLSHSRFFACCICSVDYHIQCLTDPPLINHNQWICSNCCISVFPFNHYDDDNDFLTEIDSFFGKLHIDDTEFNPFEIDDETVLFPLFNADPDFNFYNNAAQAATSDYYVEDSFNAEFDGVSGQSLSVIHLNVRSVPRNLDKFVHYISNLKVNFTVIGLSETWLNETNHMIYNIDGYNAISKYRTGRIGGGVTIYVNDMLHIIQRDDIAVFNEYVESVVIEIPKTLNELRNVIIILLYRPPNTDINIFNEIIAEMMTKVKNENKTCCIMGDFNINLLNHNIHAGTSHFLDVMYSNNLFPLITRPTRAQRNTATLIDNIFHNGLCNIQACNGILVTDISDHYPVFSIIKDNLISSDKLYFRKRDLSKKNIEKFVAMIGEENWDLIRSFDNLEKSFSYFHSKYKTLYDKCFPLKTYKFGYKNRKSWLSEGMKKSIKIKNKLYAIYKRNPTEINLEVYKQYKQNLNKVLRKAEKLHYQNLLDENKNNLKKSWNVMKNIINCNKQKQYDNEFIIRGEINKNKQQIADAFNDYFVNIGKTLSEKIPSTTTDPASYMQTVNVQQSIFLNATDAIEVSTILKTIKTKSTGWDDIHIDVLKQSTDTLMDTLVYLINSSLSQGIFPNELKIARVLPLFKSGNSKLVSNYRPVSILPVLSKIFEKVIHNRLISFINEHNVLYSHQYGFRSKHNTTMALITLVDNIVNGFDNNKFTVGTFLDYSKAFDTVDHEILLLKLNRYGIRGTANKLIRHYLSKRLQYTMFNNVCSEKKLIKCGVPQGSILGPLLFILYINDLHYSTKDSTLILFADDSSVFIQGDNMRDISNKMNRELASIYKWTNSNKLSLNVNKTYCMVFKKRRQYLNTNPNITISNKMIDIVNSTKFLGVLIDSSLTWDDHILYIRKKIAKGIGIICKARKVLMSSSLLTLYYSFIYPYLHYAIELWGGAPKTNILPLIILQNKILRIIAGVPNRTNASPLFLRYKVLDVFKVHVYKIAMFMFNFSKGECPESFNNMFTVNSNVHNYSTRQNKSYHVPLFRYTLCQNVIRYKGVIIYNHIVKVVNVKHSILTLKNHTKKYLITHDIDLFNSYN